MLRKVTILTTLLAVVLMFGSLAFSADKAKTKHEFVGVKKCKMCHKKDGIHPSWAETKHAKAWDLLSDDEKKKEDCVKCHSTGTTAKGVFLEGIQCEACHGAGADYKKKSIMQDIEKAKAAGLIIPTEKVCKACHDNVPEKFRPKEKFNFEKMKAKGVHAKAKKAEKQAEKKG